MAPCRLVGAYWRGYSTVSGVCDSTRRRPQIARIEREIMEQPNW